MSDTRLYTCNACGYVSTKNFVDDCCPICKVCSKVDVIEHWSPDGSGGLSRRPAPHAYEDDDV